jgi:hypothetical protein
MEPKTVVQAVVGLTILAAAVIGGITLLRGR